MTSGCISTRAPTPQPFGPHLADWLTDRDAPSPFGQRPNPLRHGRDGPFRAHPSPRFPHPRPESRPSRPPDASRTRIPWSRRPSSAILSSTSQHLPLGAGPHRGPARHGRPSHVNGRDGAQSGGTRTLRTSPSSTASSASSTSSRTGIVIQRKTLTNSSSASSKRRTSSQGEGCDGTKDRDREAWPAGTTRRRWLGSCAPRQPIERLAPSGSVHAFNHRPEERRLRGNSTECPRGSGAGYSPAPGPRRPAASGGAGPGDGP